MELAVIEVGMPPGYDLICTTGQGWKSWGWSCKSRTGELVIQRGQFAKEEAIEDAWQHSRMVLRLQNWPEIARRLARMIGRRFGVTLTEIRGRRKAAMLVRARHLTWWMLRELTSASYPEIGSYFRRDHTTVIAGVSKIGNEPPADRERLLADVKRELRERERRE